MNQRQSLAVEKKSFDLFMSHASPLLSYNLTTVFPAVSMPAPIKANNGKDCLLQVNK